MKVYLVIRSSGQWSDSSHTTEMVFDSREKADKYSVIETAEIMQRRESKLTDEEEEEFQKLAEADDTEEWPDSLWEHYQELSGKRYDSDAHDFNAFYIEEFEVK